MTVIHLSFLLGSRKGILFVIITVLISCVVFSSYSNVNNAYIYIDRENDVIVPDVCICDVWIRKDFYILTGEKRMDIYYILQVIRQSLRGPDLYLYIYFY